MAERTRSGLSATSYQSNTATTISVTATIRVLSVWASKSDQSALVASGVTIELKLMIVSRLPSMSSLMALQIGLPMSAMVSPVLSSLVSYDYIPGNNIFARNCCCGSVAHHLHQLIIIYLIEDLKCLVGPLFKGKVFEEAQIDDSVKTPLNEQLDGLADWITMNASVVARPMATKMPIGSKNTFQSWPNPKYS